MTALEEFESEYELPRANWTKAHWQRAAEELSARLDAFAPKASKLKRGRPRHTDGFIRDSEGALTVSQTANYAALAFQVKTSVEDAEAIGKKLSIRQAVEDAIVQAIKTHNSASPENRGRNDKPMREGRAKDMVETAYTAVRKLLKTKSGY